MTDLIDKEQSTYLGFHTLTEDPLSIYDVPDNNKNQYNNDNYSNNNYNNNFENNNSYKNRKNNYDDNKDNNDCSYNDDHNENSTCRCAVDL